MNISDTIAVIGVVVALAGILVGYIFAKRGRQEPDLRYAVDHTILLDDADGLLNEGLSLSFDDHAITKVTRTRFAIWNDRGDPVMGSSILPDDPLRIQLPDDDVALKVRVIRQSRWQIKLAVDKPSAERRSLRITFDFLARGDGAIIEVLHQGPELPELAGTVRGASLRSTGSRGMDSEAIGKASYSYLSRFFKAYREMSVSDVLGLFAFPVFLLGVLSYFFFKIHHSPNLVNPQRYNLTTLKGQYNFANKVLDVGYVSHAQLIYLFFVVAIMFVGYVIIDYGASRARLGLPKSILNDAEVTEAIEDPSADTPPKLLSPGRDPTPG